MVKMKERVTENMELIRERDRVILKNEKEGKS